MESINFGNYDKELIEAVSSKKDTIEIKYILIRYLFETYLKFCGISDDDSSNLKALVNCTDELGRTPLQIAASSGFHKICELLLDCGADIKKKTKKWPTPSELADSKGQFGVVKLFHNYPRRLFRVPNVGDEIQCVVNSNWINAALDHYIRTMNLEESEFPAFLQISLSRLLLHENKHPVRLILYLKENVVVVKNLSKIRSALDSLADSFQMWGNEWLSWVCYNIQYIFRIAQDFLSSQNTETEVYRAADYNSLDKLIKSWLKDQPLRGYSPVLLSVIEHSITPFDFEKPEIYEARKLLIAGSSNKTCLSETCETCRRRCNLQWCNVCRAIKYCSETCRRLHWFQHDAQCDKLYSTFEGMRKKQKTEMK